MPPKPHGKRIKVESLITPDQYTQLKALAEREQRSISQMVAILIYERLRRKN